jgi:uncharacterized protein
MSQYPRQLQLPQLLTKKSHFLFGPRATGKSTLIRTQLTDQALIINLLHTDYYLRLSANPSELENMICFAQAQKPDLSWIVIDEVQKIPALLDEVHRLIEEKQYRFLLTGSSARKLKSGQSNLLAGRAWRADLFPLTSREIPRFSLKTYLHHGGLPAVVQSQDPVEELHAYTALYLREEIQGEGLIRKLAPFSRFLSQAAHCNGHILNYAKIGADAQVPPATIREYFEILQDTLVGFLLPPWLSAKKRKSSATSKFFFFDIGVVNTLRGITRLEKNTTEWGMAFEHFIAMELRAALGYFRIKAPLSFWRSATHDEVDFIIGDHIAIEVKSKNKTSYRDAKGLQKIQEEGILKTYLLVSDDPICRIENGITFIHWPIFLDQLWKNVFGLVE